MKKWKQLFALMLSVCLFSLTSLTVVAAETENSNLNTADGSQKETEGENVEAVPEEPGAAEGCVYKIRILSGQKGSLDKNMELTCSYGDRITFHLSAEEMVNDIKQKSLTCSINGEQKISGVVSLEKGSKYYIKSVHESGKEESELSFLVTNDKDYVVSYGLQGPMVAYRVEFVDERGNALAETQYYEGKVGDKPVIAFLYIDGYRPQAYNLTKTLVEDPEKNVFRFVYTPGTVPTIDGGTELVTVLDGGTTVLGGGAGAGGGAGDGGAEIPDEETPLGEQPQELINLDEEDTPLANGGLFSVNGNATFLGLPIPVVIGAGLVIAGGLWYMLVYRRKKKQKEIEL